LYLYSHRVIVKYIDSALNFDNINTLTTNKNKKEYTCHDIIKSENLQVIKSVIRHLCDLYCKKINVNTKLRTFKKSSKIAYFVVLHLLDEKFMR
jgi:hypothetical protein